MQKLAIFTNKGGVGKTTLSTNLAERMQAGGKRVLFVDMDPQNNATMLMLGHVLASGSKFTTMVDIFKPVRAGAGLIGEIRPEKSKAFGVDVIAAGAELALHEDFFGGEWSKVRSGEPRAINATWSIRKSLASLEDDYDVMIMDCGPSLGALTRAGLLAADGIITPVAQDAFSLMALENMARWFSATEAAIGMAAGMAEAPMDEPLSGMPPVKIIIPGCAAGPSFTLEQVGAVRDAAERHFPGAELSELLGWAPAPLHIAQNRGLPVATIGQEHGVVGSAFAQRHAWIKTLNTIGEAILTSEPFPTPEP